MFCSQNFLNFCKVLLRRNVAATKMIFFPQATFLKTKLKKKFDCKGTLLANDCINYCLESLEELKSHKFYEENYILNLNTRSVKKNFEEFKLLIENLEKTPSVICLTETRLTQKDNPEVFNLPGYHPITQGKHRDGKRGGGIAFYIAESLQYSEVRTVTELESLTVEITLHKRVLGLICVVYRTPQSQIQSFLNQLELLLLQHDSKKDLILCGDFKISVSCPDKSASSHIVLLGSYGLYVLKNLPTRETLSSKSCIDHISMKNMTSTVTLLNKISDHYIVLAELSASFQSKSTTSFKTIEVRNYSVFSNKETHLKYLFPLDQKLKRAMTIDINETLESISKVVLETVERFAPLSVISVTRYRKAVNPEISKQIRKRDKLFQRYLKHPSPENKKAYVSIRNEVTKSIRTCKRQEMNKKIGSKPTSEQIFDSLRQITKT